MVIILRTRKWSADTTILFVKLIIWWRGGDLVVTICIWTIQESFAQCGLIQSRLVYAPVTIFLPPGLDRDLTLVDDHLIELLLLSLFGCLKICETWYVLLFLNVDCVLFIEMQMLDKELRRVDLCLLLLFVYGLIIQSKQL